MNKKMAVSSNEPVSMRELIYAVRDTVVSLTVQFESPSGLQQTRGNGVLIKGHYILCPANLVLSVPPMISYPVRILVGISGVTVIDPTNPKKITHKSYIYQAELLGGDYRGNLAILVLNMAHSWNQNNPPLEAHPTLSWGKSRNASPGDSVLIIGDINTYPSLLPGRWGPWEGSENGVLSTTVADNRYVSYDGTIPGELLLLTANHPVAAGAAVISRDGQLMGIVVPSTTPRVLALSEFFMRRPVRALIRSFINNRIPIEFENQIQLIKLASPIGTSSSDRIIYRFDKSWLGLSGILVTPDDYYTTLVINSDGTFQKHLMSIPDQLEVSEPKEIGGYRITWIAGNLQTQNKSADPSSFPWKQTESPLRSILKIGDIVTHLNECPLGDRWGQVAPSLIMWRVKPQTEVVLQYRRQAEAFTISHTLSVQTLPYPPWDDFPWYAIPARLPIQPDPILL